MSVALADAAFGVDVHPEGSYEMGVGVAPLKGSTGRE
jgi:hypothetical protein